MHEQSQGAVPELSIPILEIENRRAFPRLSQFICRRGAFLVGLSPKMNDGLDGRIGAASRARPTRGNGSNEYFEDRKVPILLQNSKIAR